MTGGQLMVDMFLMTVCLVLPSVSSTGGYNDQTLDFRDVSWILNCSMFADREVFKKKKKYGKFHTLVGGWVRAGQIP